MHSSRRLSFRSPVERSVQGTCLRDACYFNMARNKEVAIVLLDVGPLMSPIRDFAGKAVCGFLQSKMLTKPSHEVEVVLFGTTETDNPLNDEMGEDQYENITVQQKLAPPNTEFLASLLSLSQGAGSSDFVDALTVAVDRMHRVVNERPELGKANVNKRVVLVSNFLDAAKEDPDDSFGSVLVERMTDKAISMEVISVDVPQYDAQFAAAKQSNNGLLNRILGEVHHTLRHVSDPLDLLGAFKAREYSSTAYYSGPFTIADSMTIKVKYGKQTVPISAEEENHLKYQPEKGMQLIGFLNLTEVPRHSYMKDTWLVAPEKDNAGSHLALSALARALFNLKQACIIRFVPRANMAVFVGCATPLLGNGADRPDCLILNYLPFTEDVRTYKFASLDAKEELVPSDAQLQAAEDVIDVLLLDQDGSEHLKPETTANPVLHRFFAFMASRAIDPDASLPSQDLQVQHTLSCPFAHLDQAQAALDALSMQFDVSYQQPAAVPGEADGEPELLDQPQAEFRLGETSGSAVDSVSTLSPVDNFQAMLQQGQLDAALEGLQKAIYTLVDTSLGDRFYKKALQCIPVLRTACTDNAKGQTFNTFLEQMAARYEHDKLRADLWARVTDTKVSLVSQHEASDVDVTEQASEEWLKKHTPGSKAETEAAAPMDEDEDEFAGME